MKTVNRGSTPAYYGTTAERTAFAMQSTPGGAQIAPYAQFFDTDLNTSYEWLGSWQVRGGPGQIVDFAPLLASEDKRGFGSTADTAGSVVSVKRIPSATAGTFLNNGNVNLAPNGTTGSSGDFLARIRVEVKTVATGGRAGVFVSQLSDEVFGQYTTGSAITNTTTQTFTAGSNLSATANLLADRVISFFYTPTGGSAQWFTTRIVSHAAISTTSVTVVLEDTPDAGSAPTNWIIHGPRARRELDPASPAGLYTILCNYNAVTGGFVAWVGNGVVSADHFGVFSG